MFGGIAATEEFGVSSSSWSLPAGGSGRAGETAVASTSGDSGGPAISGRDGVGALALANRDAPAATHASKNEFELRVGRGLTEKRTSLHLS